MGADRGCPAGGPYRPIGPDGCPLQPAMLRSITLVHRGTICYFCGMAQTRIIKKYPNRRLYDTEISSYITLEEVRQLVLDGDAFEVRDAKTGEDLTRTVLLQIIAEHEGHGQPMFTTQLLSQVIRFYGDSMQGFMGSYLEKSLQIFLDQQGKFRSQLNNILGQTPWSMLNDMTERNLDLWKSVQDNFLKSAASAAQAQQAGAPKKDGKP